MITAAEARGKMEKSSFIIQMREKMALALSILSKRITERAEEGYNFLEVNDQDPEFSKNIFNIPEFTAKTRREMFQADLIKSLKSNGYEIYRDDYFSELKTTLTIQW